MKLSTHEIKKIAVFRALQLGDLLCSIPAMRSLRHAYPKAHITLISLPWAKSFAERFSAYFNSYISFPGYPGLPGQKVVAKGILSFLSFLQNQKFDLALQLQGNGSCVNPLIELFGTKNIAGYYKEGNYCPDKQLFIPYPDRGSEIERHLLLMQHLNINTKGSYLEFPLSDKDHYEFEKLNLPVKFKQYVCIHPGSRRPLCRWPAHYFASLADKCTEMGYVAVITGTKEERPLANEIMACMKYKAINVADKTTLGAVAVMIKNARMLICNCTGVSHLAAAFKTPSIVININAEPERWAPVNTSIHKTIDWTKNPEFEYVYQETVLLLEQTEE